MGQRGRGQREAWMAKFGEYSREYPELARPSFEDAEAGTSRRLGCGHTKFPRRRQGMGGRDSSAKYKMQLQTRTVAHWRIADLARLPPRHV